MYHGIMYVSHNVSTPYLHVRAIKAIVRRCLTTVLAFERFISMGILKDLKRPSLIYCSCLLSEADLNKTYL